MAPVTRNTTSNSNGEGVDDSTRRYVDETLAGIRQSMQEMLNQINGLSLQNQVVNSGGNRPQTQYSRMTKELKMEFVYNSRKVALRGTSKSTIQWVDEENIEQGGNKSEISPELLQVVEEFDDVFEIPKELPPKRTHDRKIPLIEGTPPVNIRPNRHPPIQKDAIETMMNDVFKAYLRKFTLVFFDDILIYSKSLSDHVGHLTMVLQTMRQNKLFAKRSVFGTSHVEYLGHVISLQGVATHLTKTSLSALKATMTMAPVLLALPDFSKPFEVETNVSGIEIRGVLQQNGHPIAYLSKALAPKHQALSTYEKEFFDGDVSIGKVKRVSVG
nr:reverse transcriptase [Tanacetum cinerariifolium]